MSKPGAPGFLVSRANIVIESDGDDRDSVIFAENYAETV
jgi:hypothetical protein